MGPFARLAAVQDTGVVLDAVAEAHFQQHFNIVIRALFEPLGGFFALRTKAELFDGAVNPAFLDLMSFQVRRAREYLERGRRLIPLLSHRSRACPAILHGIYSRVLDRIESSEYNVFNGRIGLATSEKVLLMAKIWIQSLFPGNPVHRQS
ncbi:MAG: squalene/phytoene synthase family protein [Proteobacteria bacterium]|nr:squalene/phytoene synthase family protein [Pseudomonadota bacterium]